MESCTNRGFHLVDMKKQPRIFWFSEISSYIVGLSLLMYVFVAWANGQLDNRLAINSFESQLNLAGQGEQSSVGQSGAPESDMHTAHDVNLADWSKNRIVAWKATFSDKGPGAFAILSVPSAGISVPVFEGTSDRNLNAGAAWIEGTDKPGFDYGNTGIAGHRDGFFRGLQNVKVGEPISLQTDGEKLVYRISDISIVDPTNIETLLPQQEETITLVTCYPFYFVGHAPQRYVVQAVRQREYQNKVEL